MGLITTPWAILMIPASVLIAFGFASFGMGITSFMKTFQQMDWINFIMLPMFLFSATFYPLSVYPQYIQWLIQAMPLWHGVELLRQISVGVVHPGHGRAHRLLPRDDRPRRAAHHRTAARSCSSGREPGPNEVPPTQLLAAGAFGPQNDNMRASWVGPPAVRPGGSGPGARPGFAIMGPCNLWVSAVFQAVRVQRRHGQVLHASASAAWA